MNLQAVYLASPVNEVRKLDGSLFMRAEQPTMLAMIAYKAVEPKFTETGKLQYWKLVKGANVNRLRMTLKAGRGTVSAEDSKTCIRDGRGYRHHALRCAAFAR